MQALVQKPQSQRLPGCGRNLLFPPAPPLLFKLLFQLTPDSSSVLLMSDQVLRNELGIWPSTGARKQGGALQPQIAQHEEPSLV